MITLEQLKQYIQTEIELKKVCEEWAKQNLDKSWQHYCGFYIQNGYVVIRYSYTDIVNNIEYETECGSKCVDFTKIVEFSKTLEL